LIELVTLSLTSSLLNQVGRFSQREKIEGYNAALSLSLSCARRRSVFSLFRQA
jgi:hypothetical protein